MQVVKRHVQWEFVAVYYTQGGSGNSLRQTVHRAAKLVAALLRVAAVTAGLAESNGNLSPGL